MFFPRSRPLRYFLLSLAALLVVVGILIGAFQIAVARVPEYRDELQSWLDDKTGLAIEFTRISARLRLYGPELVFHDAIVRTPDRTRVLATARRGSVGFDLWNSLRTLRFTAGRFTLDSPAISLIRTREGRIRLAGQSALPEHEARPMAVDSLPIGEFSVRNAVVSFTDKITGRGPWSLSGVNFVLERQTDLLVLTGDASLPRTLGESLRFSARVAGALDDVDSLVSNFSIEGRGLDLAGWQDVLPNHWLPPETGHGSIELSSTFNGIHPTGVTAKVDLSNVSAAVPQWVTPLPGSAPLIVKLDEDEPSVPTAAAPDAAPADAISPAPAEKNVEELVSFERLALDLRAVRQNDSWTASVSNLDMSRKQSPWRANRIEASWSAGETSPRKLDVSADRIVLENLWPLLAYLPESDSLAHLRALKAHGTVENLSFSSAQPAADQPSTYSVKADVSDAGVAPVLSAPGVSGISAHIEGTEERGTVHVTAKDVGFELPRMFRWPLTAQSVDGVLNWERSPQAWRVSSDELRVATVDGNAQVKMALTLPGDQSSPILELSGQAQDLNAASTAKYLPADKLTPKTLAWLDAAFQTGHVRTAQVAMHGPIRSFPFRRGEGDFLIRGQVENITFNYQEGWAPAEDVAAVVEFHNQGMRVLSGTAAVGSLHVGRIAGDFRDFHAGDLVIRAQATGDLGNALKLLQTSPISSAFGDQFQTLRGQGATTTDVSLHLPLKHMAKRRIEVVTKLADATVSSSGIDAPITALSGSLTVRQSLPESADLRGQWLGGPLAVAVEPVASAVPTSVLTARGHASTAQLAPVLHLPASVKISGDTDWQMTTRLETAPDTLPTPRQPRKFTVESDLDGFGIGLPYPVGKTAQELRPLRVELEYDGDATLLARAALGDVHALLRLRQQRDGWQFDRGGVRLDAVAAALPSHPGLGIDGELDRLNLDDWLALRGTGSGNSSVSDYLKAINIHVGALQAFGYQFPDVRGVVRVSNSTWQVDVAGPNAEGALTIPGSFTGADSLTLKMDRLVVMPVEEKPDDPSGHSDPRNWPNLLASVQDLRYDGHPVGAVTMQATRVPFGLRIDSMTVIQDAMHGEAHGQWLITPDGERTDMSALVSSTDMAASLRALNYTAFMEAKHWELTADLSWPGGFNGDFLGRASGTVGVVAENGQILNVQPGASRVLGLFSVAALPRRLSLDFSDLTDKGLSFDSIHGDFELRDGNAYTDNVLLRGPAAEIGIAGRVGLGTHDYDQTAIVTGNLGASLPVAGALAGGPAVGAALLLFSQVFKEPLKGITRGYYRITGPWDNPVVERVDASQIKEAATSAKDGA